MNPFYFGTAERRLFGIYEPARRAPANRAAVLCHPWGSEHLHAYRSMRQLSNMLAAAGVHTLRFDYFGTGDSAGEMTSGDLGGWEADIRSAMEELRSIAGAAQVALVGLRLGATLAANVAVRPDAEVNSLVLWDPVIRGAEHVEELHLADRTRRFGPKRPVARPGELGGGHEILGFPLTAVMAREFNGIDLTALAPDLPTRTLIVASHPVGSHAGLQRALDRRAAGPLAIEHIAGRPGWIELPLGHPNAGTVPVKVLQRIVEWFA